jgi:hypothetical protein
MSRLPASLPSTRKSRSVIVDTRSIGFGYSADAQAIERLRANQTGTGSNEFKWAQVFEIAYDPKTYLWIGMALLLNVGAAVANAFGPTLLAAFGFEWVCCQHDDGQTLTQQQIQLRPAKHAVRIVSTEPFSCLPS